MDFKTFHLRNKERRDYWKKVLKMNTILGDDTSNGWACMNADSDLNKIPIQI